MKKRKILIVDDERPILKLYARILEKEGYAVTTAESAGQALEILKHVDFQVMFLDLQMPEMNGVELCKEIRKDFPTACIYSITGYPSLFEVADCRAAGFDKYFTKPLNADTLIEIARQAFKDMENRKS